MKQKPLHRDKNLVFFSHEHHHGLVFATRLKKTLRTNGQTLKRFVRDFWENHLASHFEQEEKLLLPLIDQSDIQSRFIQEHRRIRELVKVIDGTEGDDRTAAIQLGKAIIDHIRFEEREMFPWLEMRIDPEDLRDIGAVLEGTEIAPHDFKPEFWKRPEA